MCSALRRAVRTSSAFFFFFLLHSCRVRVGLRAYQISSLYESKQKKVHASFESRWRVRSNVSRVGHYHFHLQLKVPPKFIRTALSRAGFIRQQLARDNSSHELPDKTAASMCVYNTCKLTARLSHIISHLLEKPTLQSSLINYLGVGAKRQIYLLCKE